MAVTNEVTWEQVLANLPLIAILRGVASDNAVDIAEALRSAGFLCVEVPLNSLCALESIAKIRTRLEGHLLVGAGTVLSVPDVVAVRQAGAQLIVSPNTNPDVIAVTKEQGLVSVPGFATPGEAFAAQEAGADALKLFPAEGAPPAVLRALRAVLPSSLPVLPVGGITRANMEAYRAAGASGFGIGSAIYSPGRTPEDVRERGLSFVEAWHTSRR